MYAHDNDLASWIVKDIVFDHHIRLIGQLTSSPGIFIGPYFYYSLIPFYWLTNWNPIGTVLFSIVIGIISIASIHYVFYRLYGKIPAAFASLLYSVSWGIVGTERDVFPTTPVFLWTIWFFYSIHLLFKGQKKALTYLFILMALVWHLNLALGLLFPLILIAVFIHRKKYILKDFITPLIAGIIISLPLIIFELRHNFSQTRALFGTLFGMGEGKIDFLSKLIHTLKYASINSTRIFIWNPTFSVYIIPVILILSFIILYLLHKYYEKYSLFLYICWLSLLLLFFTFNSINLSEYYLNGLTILTITFTTLLSSYLYSLHASTRLTILCIFTFFIYHNINTFIHFPYSHSGYIEKTALVKFISLDAKNHQYPCVSVSYISSPGNNLGYRYLFYLENLHVNQPKSESPVYTIVFPLSYVDHFDISFGAIGLILPDYSRYNPKDITISCSGQNANLTDPMFGFTN
jgi:hypothetical protein